MRNKLVFATNNDHKLMEIRKIMPDSFDVAGMKDIGCTADIEESADTLEGNADLKAKYIFENYAVNCFADDTGLEVEALNGEPGVYSARYAGEEGNAEKNIDKLLHKLGSKSNRKARFRTVITLILDGQLKHFEGIVDGHIIYERRGKAGFGYDPIFVPNDHKETFAEMPLDIKNTISHRGRATQKLISYLEGLEE